MPRRLRIRFTRKYSIQCVRGNFAWAGVSSVLSKGGNSTPPYIPPHWIDPLPAFTFVYGVPSTQTFSGYFIDGNGGTSTITGQNLPSGVTVNSALRRFEYDGNGAVATASNVTLTADDGYGVLDPITTLVVRDTAGTAGMVFAEGDVPSGLYVGADVPGFQCDIKNRWPDGSAKIGVVSWSGVTASSGSPATLTISSTAGAPAGSAISLMTLRGLGLTGSVALGSYGTVNLAAVIAGAPFRQWLSGPQCSEWHWRAPVGSDQTLVCWLYVRLYAPSAGFPSGRVWMRIIVENGYMFVSPQTSKVCRAIVTLNGVTAYDSVSNLTHYSRARWSMEFWYDGGVLQAPGHDGTYLKSTKLLPNYALAGTPAQKVYDGTFADVTGCWNDNLAGTRPYPVTTVVPYDYATQRHDMTAGGYAPSIGVIPMWDALYLTATQGSANQEKMYFCSVANATASGAFSIFIRDEATNLPLKFSDRPNVWFQGGDGNSVVAATGGPPTTYERDHSPSFAYATYLFTGDYFYLEVMQFQAAYNFGFTSYAGSKRDGAKGILSQYETTRAFAWGIRTLGQVMCITPDADTTFDASWLYSFQQNIERLIQIHIDGNFAEAGWNTNKNTLGVTVYGPAVANSIGYAGNQFVNGYRGDAPWMQNFVGAALAHLDDLEIVSGADQTNLRRLMTFSLSHAVGLLGTNAGWPYTFAGAYAIPYVNSSYQFAADWDQAWTFFRDSRTDEPDAKVGGGPSDGAALVDTAAMSEGRIWNGYAWEPSFGISMWSNLFPAISAAVDKGVPGASAARARMLSASNWAEHQGYTVDRPYGWVVPR